MRSEVRQYQTMCRGLLVFWQSCADQAMRRPRKIATYSYSHDPRGHGIDAVDENHQDEQTSCPNELEGTESNLDNPHALDPFFGRSAHGLELGRPAADDFVHAVRRELSAYSKLNL
jgi:hypothetical protein